MSGHFIAQDDYLRVIVQVLIQILHSGIDNLKYIQTIWPQQSDINVKWLKLMLVHACKKIHQMLFNCVTQNYQRSLMLWTDEIQAATKLTFSSHQKQN